MAAKAASTSGSSLYPYFVNAVRPAGETGECSICFENKPLVALHHITKPLEGQKTEKVGDTYYTVEKATEAEDKTNTAFTNVIHFVVEDHGKKKQYILVPGHTACIDCYKSLVRTSEVARCHMCRQNLVVDGAALRDCEALLPQIETLYQALNTAPKTSAAARGGSGASSSSDEEISLADHPDLDSLTKDGWASKDDIRKLTPIVQSYFIISAKNIEKLKEKVSFDSITFAQDWVFSEYLEYSVLSNLEKEYRLATSYRGGVLSSLAHLYRLAVSLAFREASMGESEKTSLRGDVVRRVHALKEKSEVYELIWRENGELPGDPQWGEHHILYNSANLVGALRKLILLKILRMPPTNESRTSYEADIGEGQPYIMILANCLSS